MAEGNGTRIAPITLISAFGLSVVSALIYAGVTMQRINQLETNDGGFQKQLTELAASFDRRMTAMAESRYAKQTEFEAKIAHLDRTDAARTEELRAMHQQLDESARRMTDAGNQILDRLQQIERGIGSGAR